MTCIVLNMISRFITLLAKRVLKSHKHPIKGVKNLIFYCNKFLIVYASNIIYRYKEISVDACHNIFPLKKTPSDHVS